MDRPKTLRNILNRTFRKLKGKYLTKKTLNHALKIYKNKSDKELNTYEKATLKLIDNSKKNLKQFGHNTEKAKELKKRIYEELEVYRTLQTIKTARSRKSFFNKVKSFFTRKAARKTTAKVTPNTTTPNLKNKKVLVACHCSGDTIHLPLFLQIDNKEMSIIDYFGKENVYYIDTNPSCKGLYHQYSSWKDVPNNFFDILYIHKCGIYLELVEDEINKLTGSWKDLLFEGGDRILKSNGHIIIPLPTKDSLSMFEWLNKSKVSDKFFKEKMITLLKLAKRNHKYDITIGNKSTSDFPILYKKNNMAPMNETYIILEKK